MKNLETALCKTNNINISYTRSGGNKPPLILLHGLMTNGLCWIDLAQALEGNYDVIMPDARGHGKSSKPNYGYSYEDHANDIIGFIKALELPPVILLGHSMGGMTASLVASRKTNLLRGLVLADPTFLTLEVQQEVYNSDVAEQHKKVLEMSINEIISEAKNRNPNRSNQTIEMFAQARLQTSIDAFDVLIPPNPDYKELISKIDVPSLLVFGDKGIVSSTVAEELQALNSLLKIKEIENARHSLHLDQPDCFRSIVASFLESI